MDDAVDLPPPSRDPGPRRRARRRRDFEATVGAADLVLCGNRELAARLPHDRFELLPTPIDTSRFAPRPDGGNRGKVLGWVGHSDNLPYLEALAPPLRELARRHRDLRVVVVADRPPRLDGIAVEYRRWSLEDEVTGFRGIAVGLMPLEDTPWARAKCAFKAIQYMALAIPAVASPVGLSSEVIEHGRTGFLAASEHEWLETLDRLLTDPALAQRVGEAGRAAVVARYSLPVVSRRLVEILEAVAR
jgi:glycosyltransferase involved in cell wall biosynthesis